MLNFGSLNRDHVYTVEHFVRPCETVSSLAYQGFCGGKGLNQSIALARAGCEVFHAGKLGEDGGDILNLLAENGIHTEFVGRSPKPTGHAIIQVDRDGQNCILLYGGANQDIGEDFAREVLDRFGKGEILLLQNEISDLKFIIEYAHEKGMRIALNPSPVNDGLRTLPLEYVSWFIMNEIEGQELTGKEEPDEILDVMLKMYPNSAAVLTLGEAGVRYADAQVRAAQDIFQVNVRDTTAAGDTFTGYFLSEVTGGSDINTALKTACAASAIAVSRAGASASIPKREDVRLFLQKNK